MMENKTQKANKSRIHGNISEFFQYETIKKSKTKLYFLIHYD